MTSYANDSILFYLNHMVDWETYYKRFKGDAVDVESEIGALEGAIETYGQICSQIEGVSFDLWDEVPKLVDDAVTLPLPMQEGYDRLAAAGLVAYGVREEYGGFELPSLVSNMFLEMVSRANGSLMTVVGLQSGVAEDIQKFASKEICDKILPKFVSGEYQGVMALTEPNAGSDLGAITTRVVCSGEAGSFKSCYVTGEKIFITNGGAEVHLVLARDDDTFEETKGTTKGLSLILCQRTFPGGKKNGIHVERLEHKLGIHGSPTCTVRYDEAMGFRIGGRGEGFKCMLELMNHARLGVAAQGIGIAEAALQESLEYAGERKQFGVTIDQQPLMKNYLAEMTVAIEGSRALLYRTSVLIDQNRAIERRIDQGEPDASELARLSVAHGDNSKCIRLLTPLAKYTATEMCDRVTRKAIQIHGGNGYMAESAVAKLHLDGIITTIYEGTSEIQASFALKEIAKGGLRALFDELRQSLETMSSTIVLANYVSTALDEFEKGIEKVASNFSVALFRAADIADAVSTLVIAVDLLEQSHKDSSRESLAVHWIENKIPVVTSLAVGLCDESALLRAEQVLAK